MKITDFINKLEEGVVKSSTLTIAEVAKNAQYNMDKFMPDDPDLQDEFYEMDIEEKISLIDSYIDDFFARYYDSEKEMDFISANRMKIIEMIAKKS